MEPKNYATIHSLLKQEWGEKGISEEEAEVTHEDQELEKVYKQISQDEERKN
ncbi:3956_t:CDS:2 [Gigaspora margarita]|uniref:3956_t:CDS:1 n=1 Tax=Gigaspora margarita TaxID=4874 RepID=A0ABN7WSG9_GIGMA|nr:3956_t:CDS:2 [Gigaspora margarita]